MALVNGTNLVLYASDGGVDKAFGHSRSFTLNVEANTIDATSRASAGWSEFIMGSRTFSLDFEGLVSYDDDINVEWLQTAVENKTKFLVKFTDNLAGDLVYNGYVYISNLSIDSPNEDVVTYSGTLQGTEIFSISGESPGGDTDADAFLSAAGITDPTQVLAVTTLVEDLKAEELWDKFYAIYPFVGGTATTHKFNLKNPADTDGAYRLSFNGNWIHSQTGVLPDVTGLNPTDPGPYANTFITNKDLTNFHISYYSRTLEAAEYSDTMIGVSDYNTSDVSYVQLTSRDSNGNAVAQINTASVEAPNADGRGFYLGVRPSTYVTKLFKNGSLLDSTTGSLADTGQLANPLFIGNMNQSGGTNYAFSVTNKQCAFASIGTALTDAEALTLHSIVQDFQTTLSRQV